MVNNGVRSFIRISPNAPSSNSHHNAVLTVIYYHTGIIVLQ